jgi:hypothetical protein
MKDPKEYKELFTLFKAGLASGLISKEEVTKWADEIILLEDEPNIFFIELSLIKSKNEGISYLGEHLESDSLAKGKAILGLLYKRFKEGQELERIVRTMYNLRDEADFTELERGYIYQIDDGFDLANSKIYGSLDNVRQETADFLALYSEYTIENHSRWPELDKRIDSDLEEIDRASRENYLEEQKKP